ncbi:unnamed protein product, partial [Musa acuminata var. zebrina]
TLVPLSLDYICSLYPNSPKGLTLLFCGHNPNTRIRMSPTREQSELQTMSDNERAATKGQRSSIQDEHSYGVQEM